MPNRSPPPSARPGLPAKPASRGQDAERLAKALRENLLKRKSQARARGDTSPSPGKYSPAK